MTNVFVHLILPFQWLLGGACAEPATRLGTVSPLVGRTATDQRINSPADGESKRGAFVKTLNIILPKSFIFAAKLSCPVEWGLGGTIQPLNPISSKIEICYRINIIFHKVPIKVINNAFTNLNIKI